MENNLLQAFQILLVGMGTVFFILSLVVGLSKLLISIVNSYTVSEKKIATLVPTEHIVAIQSAVEHSLKGKGIITDIIKISKHK